MATKTKAESGTSVMQALAGAVKTTTYKPPIVGKPISGVVGNISLDLLRSEEFFASNHTGSPCPCK